MITAVVVAFGCGFVIGLRVGARRRNRDAAVDLDPDR